MKIKSLILSSVAAVGFSTGAMAADFGTVLTSLDVCDSLGIAGLTTSSDTNCLTITGGASYDFKWGDYDGAPITYGHKDFADDAGANNWDSKVDAWLKFVGTASSSFGPASATIKLDFDQDYDETGVVLDRFRVEEAYVSVGDTTVLMAGLKGTIANFGDDKPLNWLGLFHSNWVDVGVGNATMATTGGHVIQVTSDLGNGISVGAALEDLNGTGTAVGVLAYAGNGVTAHITAIAGDVLTGTVTNWDVHAGFTATMDMYTVGGALNVANGGWWDVMGTASVTYDMFTLAVSGEATSATEYGLGASASAEVTSGVTLNAGLSWFERGGVRGYEVAGQVVAAVTETVTITGTVGYLSDDTPKSNFYGAGKVAWAPGGGLTSSVEGKFYDSGAYSVQFKAAKNFE